MGVMGSCYRLFFLAMAEFTLEADCPSQVDNPSSKSVKIDGKTDE